MTDCQHHWRVSSPAGRQELKGYCSRCGSERTFPAVVETDKQAMHLFGSKEAKPRLEH